MTGQSRCLTLMVLIGYRLFVSIVPGLLCRYSSSVHNGEIFHQGCFSQVDTQGSSVIAFNLFDAQRNVLH